MDSSSLIRLFLIAARTVGIFVTLRIMFYLCGILRAVGGMYQWSDRFFWNQILPVYVPEFALLILLLLPFSLIRSPLLWHSLLLAVVVLSLLWFVPLVPKVFVPHLTYLGPAPGHEKEAVPQKIIIARSYRGNTAFPIVSSLAGLLVLQIGTIWYSGKHRTSFRSIQT